MYYKIIWNNQIIDVLNGIRYAIYLPKANRAIFTDRFSANAVCGSSGQLYHLIGTQIKYPSEIKDVTVVEITEDEYKKLTETWQQTSASSIEDRLNKLEALLQI